MIEWIGGNVNLFVYQELVIKAIEISFESILLP